MTITNESATELTQQLYHKLSSFTGRVRDGTRDSQSTINYPIHNQINFLIAGNVSLTKSTKYIVPSWTCKDRKANLRPSKSIKLSLKFHFLSDANDQTYQQSISLVSKVYSYYAVH